MNQMFDIYNNYADLYDELVNHEDYKSNLKAFLNCNIEWNDKTVYEFGVGTGRVTKLYIDKVRNAILCDNSQHMIDKAKLNLEKWSNKITFNCVDNIHIDKIIIKNDVVIEGWSFGHLIVNEKNDIDLCIHKLINESIRISNDKIVFIETMGTNVKLPSPPGEMLTYFYNKLKLFGFKEYIIETDYEFINYKEASRVMGAFFGDNMKSEILNRKINQIGEYTGIWIFKK